jgi:hypothetical protein
MGMYLSTEEEEEFHPPSCSVVSAGKKHSKKQNKIGLGKSLICSDTYSAHG